VNHDFNFINFTSKIWYSSLYFQEQTVLQVMTNRVYWRKKIKNTNKLKKNIINMTSGSTYSTHWVNEIGAGSIDNPNIVPIGSMQQGACWWSLNISFDHHHCTKSDGISNTKIHMVHLYLEIFACAGKLCKYIKNQALEASETKQGHQGPPGGVGRPHHASPDMIPPMPAHQSMAQAKNTLSSLSHRWQWRS
jgi:hypothetical protein